MPAADYAGRVSAAARVSVLTLGCARNEVDSSELAGRLELGGFELVDDAAGTADVVVVNTCAFVADAKKDSIDTLLAAADTGAKVVAVGCLAERYGQTPSPPNCPRPTPSSVSTATPSSPALLDDVLAGRRPASHQSGRPAHPAADQPGGPAGRRPFASPSPATTRYRRADRCWSAGCCTAARSRR